MQRKPVTANDIIKIQERLDRLHDELVKIECMGNELTGQRDSLVKRIAGNKTDHFELRENKWFIKDMNKDGLEEAMKNNFQPLLKEAQKFLELDEEEKEKEKEQEKKSQQKKTPKPPKRPISEEFIKKYAKNPQEKKAAGEIYKPFTLSHAAARQALEEEAKENSWTYVFEKDEKREMKQRKAQRKEDAAIAKRVHGWSAGTFTVRKGIAHYRNAVTLTIAELQAERHAAKPSKEKINQLIKNCEFLEKDLEVYLDKLNRKLKKHADTREEWYYLTGSKWHDAKERKGIVEACLTDLHTVLRQNEDLNPTLHYSHKAMLIEEESEETLQENIDYALRFYGGEDISCARKGEKNLIEVASDKESTQQESNSASSIKPLTTPSLVSAYNRKPKALVTCMDFKQQDGSQFSVSSVDRIKEVDGKREVSSEIKTKASSALPRAKQGWINNKESVPHEDHLDWAACTIYKLMETQRQLDQADDVHRNNGLRFKISGSQWQPDQVEAFAIMHRILLGKDADLSGIHHQIRETEHMQVTSKKMRNAKKVLQDAAYRDSKDDEHAGLRAILLQEPQFSKTEGKRNTLFSRTALDDKSSSAPGREEYEDDKKQTESEDLDDEGGEEMDSMNKTSKNH